MNWEAIYVVAEVISTAAVVKLRQLNSDRLEVERRS